MSNDNKILQKNINSFSRELKNFCSTENIHFGSFDSQHLIILILVWIKMLRNNDHGIHTRYISENYWNECGKSKRKDAAFFREATKRQNKDFDELEVLLNKCLESDSESDFRLAMNKLGNLYNVLWS